MFRLWSLASQPNLLLIRRALIQHEFTAKYEKIAIFKKQVYRERDPCPAPPPPPPPPPRDDSLLWGALAAAALSAAFIVFAKSNPEVRDWLTINMPILDEVIAVVYQENMTHKQFVLQTMCAITDYFERDSDAPKKCTDDGRVIIPVKLDDEVTGTQGKTCYAEPLPVTTDNINEVKKCIVDVGEHSLYSFMTVRDACKYYNGLAQEMQEDLTVRDMNKVHAAIKERKGLLDDHLQNAQNSKEKLRDIHRCLETNLAQGQVEPAKKMVLDFLKKIEVAESEFLREHETSTNWDSLYVEELEPILRRYANENDTLLRGVDYEAKRPMMPNGDPDLLLIHTLKYCKKLSAELDEASATMTSRIDRDLKAYSKGPKADEERDAEIKKMFTAKQQEFKKSQAQALANIKPTLSKRLKKLMDKQTAYFKNITPIRLKEKEKETEVVLNKMVDAKVAEEKLKMKGTLEKLKPHVNVLEEKLNASLKAERETRRSQQLWAAGSSLLRATKKGDPIVKVEKEIKAIEKARGEGDKLVDTVLKSIPESVKKEGVVPESVIRERFNDMERCAKAVAMVEHDGAPLVVYMLSLLQSIMLFMRIPTIPQKEIDNPPIEPFQDMDTFDLLRRARYYLSIGNLPQAIRYVDALKGASRVAAMPWYDAARGLVITRQAAEAIVAHASALGLQYL